MKGISLIEVKEELLKEHEKHQRTENNEESAFKARGKPAQRQKQGRNGRGPRGGQRGKRFEGRCFKCNKVGHKQVDCRVQASSDEEMMFMANTSSRSGWLLDSGASSHMSPQKSDYCSYRVLPSPIEMRIADGETLRAVEVDDIAMKSNNGKTVRMTDVLHIPRLDRRLMSVSKLVMKGLVVEFSENECAIKKGDRCVLRAPRRGSMYKVETEPMEADQLVEHNRATSE